MISAQTHFAFVARENRFTPRIKCGAGFFRIMLRRQIEALERLHANMSAACLREFHAGSISSGSPTAVKPS
jgi:hypothetical protein